MEDKDSAQVAVEARIITQIEDLGFTVAAKPEWGTAAFSLNQEIGIQLAYARPNARREFVFKLDKDRLEALNAQQPHFFLFLICDSPQRAFVLPLSLLLEICHDNYASGHDFKAFQPIIKLRNGIWFLRFGGQYELMDYLNRYDFLVSESKTFTRQPQRFNSIIEVATLEERQMQWRDSGELKGDSLHNLTVDMLRKIGEWSGFEVLTETVPQQWPNFPYQIDCLWYKNGDLYMAIEVCHQGSVEKDKDALKLAKQHGARKVVIVAEINKIARIRKLFQLEGDIKSWAEVWSFERIFNLYDTGARFFKDFEKFKRYGWREGLGEFI